MFGKRIQESRKLNNLTQAQLAVLLGVSSKMISDIEKEVKEPNIALLNKLSKTLNQSVDYLIGRDKLNSLTEDGVYLPSVSVRLNDKISADGLKGIIASGKYPKLIESIMNKIIEEPDIFSNKKAKEKDISIELFNIANSIASMGREQGRLQNQLDNSLKIINDMNEEMSIQSRQTETLVTTLKEVLDILSSSKEGLSILSQLESKNINIQSIATSTIETKVESVAPKAKPVEYIPSQSFSPIISEEIDDDDDLFQDDEFSKEEMAEIISRLKSE